jgi:hypothetical protein
MMSQRPATELPGIAMSRPANYRPSKKCPYVRTELVKPLRTDCLRVIVTSTPLSYRKTSENRTEENNTEGSNGGAKSRRTWGFLWRFCGVKSRSSIHEQGTTVFGRTFLSERLQESDGEGTSDIWRKPASEIIGRRKVLPELSRRPAVDRGRKVSRTLVNDGLAGQRWCPPETSRAIDGETVRASLP